MHDNFLVASIILSLSLIPCVVLSSVITSRNESKSTYTNCLEVMSKDKHEDVVGVCKRIVKGIKGKGE